MQLKKSAGHWVRQLSGDTLMVRSLERELILRLGRLSTLLPPGSRILDIGAKSAQCTFHTLDIEARYNPDVIAELDELGKVVPEGSYDAILCTEVLEHTRNPSVAVEEMRKALKPGGVLLASSPFIIPYHPDPSDYWRMTAEGWAVLKERFSHVDILPHGNQALCVWYLAGMGWGMPLRLLDWAVFAMFGRLRGAGVFLGFVVEARR
jgi:SAM-dependent methyltransferase